MGGRYENWVGGSVQKKINSTQSELRKAQTCPVDRNIKGHRMAHDAAAQTSDPVIALKRTADKDLAVID